MEIEDVFEARMTCGLSSRSSCINSSCLIVKRSGAASMTRSQTIRSCACRVPRIASKAPVACSVVNLPLAVSRSRLRRMVSIPRSTKRCSTSHSITLYPLRAKTWAIPLPMVPAPTTPTTLIVLNWSTESALAASHQHAGDVIPAAGLIRRLDQLRARLLQIPGGVQNPRDTLVIHFPHQAIRSQQIQVAVRHHKVDHIRVHFILCPHRPRNDIAHRRYLGLRRGELPKPYLFIHQRMIASQTLQLAVAKTVTAAVSSRSPPRIAA